MRFVLRASSSANEKFGVELDDGSVVEAVIYRGHTLCLSCQVGCAVGCPFCASGHNGLRRNLVFDELVGQVDHARRHQPALKRVTLSGVGEPLHNVDAVEAFLHWCRREKLAPSLTTSGGKPSHLKRFIELPHNGLTVSVHAGTEAMRRKLVPRGPSLTTLFATVEMAFQGLSRSRQRRVSLGYLLIDGCNDGAEETGAFAWQAKRMGVSVYVYRLNPVVGLDFNPAGEETYQSVVERFQKVGLEVRRSSRARVEEVGGCGTLLAVRGSPSC